MTVTTRIRRRGEHDISRKTIARGMPGDFRCDRGDYTRVPFHIAREAAGALDARHSLRPLIMWANGSCKTSGDQRRGNAMLYPQTTPFEIESAYARKRVYLSPCGRGRIASTDAIRVRDYALSIDRDPSPQPSATRGEGAHRRRGDIDVIDRTDKRGVLGTRWSLSSGRALRGPVGGV